MATKSISQLDTQATANETDLFEVAIVDANSASGYASKKESAAAIADAIVGEYQYPLRITGTTAKTIAGAINELKNLVDLLPQFAIEVVNTLPVSDISETTIYLVPASDPEQGNYYEEYIYVNNAWELVGTTAVDLSGYYTSAQVDTLLAAKANTSSLATVATSGAYSDLTGKPTIDTALDTTSTNAVENRAVASEINSIKSDITVEGSASGDIATFVDGSDNPLRELKISIEAVQSGSGDPSPTNIRPITGWTGANIYVSDEDTSNPTTYNINWQSTAGTVYGGYLNVKTGELTVTHQRLNLGSLSWSFVGGYGSATNVFGAYSTGKPTSSSQRANARCEVYKVIANDDLYNGLDKTISIVTSGQYIFIRINDTTYSSEDLTDFTNFVTDKYLVRELATPVTYQLTPTEIRSLLGTNNVWADCGAITELKYTRDLNLCINDIIARIEALEGGSSTRSLSVSPTLTKSLTSELNTAEGKTEETEEETKEEAQNER